MFSGMNVEMGNGWSAGVLSDGDLGVLGCSVGMFVVTIVEEDVFCCCSW